MDDCASSVCVSETDHMVFTVLSNTEKINMNSLNRQTRAESPARIVEVSEEGGGGESAPQLPSPVIAHDDAECLDPPIPVEDDLHGGTVPESNDDVSLPLPRVDEGESVPHADYRENDDYRSPPDNPFENTSSPVLDRGPECGVDDEEKRTVLMDLQQLKIVHGVVLTKEWTMRDRLEDMMLEMRRHTLALDERSNVNMMRDGLKFLATGIEVVNQRLGLLDLEGWSTEVCRDIGKHDANLSRIYRRYWRRSTSSSPEVEIAMSLAGSMGFFHMKKTMAKHVLGRPKQGKGFSRRRAPNPDTSDDEEAPPR